MATTRSEERIACSLEGGSYRERVDLIADLMREGLRGYERRDLVLTLRFSAHVQHRVRDLVAKERACCAFLQFDVAQREDEIHVTISAPERARDSAEFLFEHFLPECDRQGGRSAAPGRAAPDKQRTLR